MSRLDNKPYDRKLPHLALGTFLRPGKRRLAAVAASCLAAGALAALAAGRVVSPDGSALLLEASLGPAVVAVDAGGAGLSFRLALGAAAGVQRLP